MNWCNLKSSGVISSEPMLFQVNSGGDITHAGTSQRQFQPSLLRGSPTATPLQQYRGRSSKHPRHAAGISLSSDTLFGLSVHMTTFWTVHSLLLHYFFLAPSSSLLTAHTPQRSGSHRVNIRLKALSCKKGRG